MKYTADAAFRLLNRFRFIPEAIEGFLMLRSANVFIVDDSKGQLLLGKQEGEKLTSRVFNFFSAPYGELFNTLCAISSSSNPVIIEHVIESKDHDHLEVGFMDSRLGGFSKSIELSKTGLNLTLAARVEYPNA